MQPLFLQTKLRNNQNLINKPGQRKFIIGGLVDSLKALWVLKLLWSNKSALKLLVANDIEQMTSLSHYITLFAPSIKVGCFPNLDILPYEDISASPTIVAKRILTLYNILHKKCDIVLTTLPALAGKIIPQSILPDMLLHVTVGHTVSRQVWLSKLKQLGYSNTEQIEMPGEFCFKGEKLDIFSANYDNPLRISFFGDEVEKISFFDLETQRSKTNQPIEGCYLVAVSEVPYAPTNLSHALDKLDEYRSQVNYQHYQEIINYLQIGHIFGYANKIMPLFFDATAALFDYLPADCVCFLIDEAKLKNTHNFLSEEIAREHLISKEQQQVTLPMQELFIEWSKISEALSKYITVDLITQVPAVEDYKDFFTIDNQFIINRTGHSHASFSSLKDLFNQVSIWHTQGVKIAFFMRLAVMVERLEGYLNDVDLPFEVIYQPSTALIEQILLAPAHRSIVIVVADLTKGYRLYDSDGHLKQVVISDFDLFGTNNAYKKRRKSLINSVSHIGDLKVGDYVTHIDYGIARYEGLTHFPYQQNTTDCVLLSYYGNDKVYVPVDDINLIQKYSSPESHHPSLHKLGDTRWEKQKSRVKKALEDIAQELLDVYAKRKSNPGISFIGNPSQMFDFARLFKYDETEDQKQAIEDVLADLASDKPMDRLICGDVGFGKTEVALRASFKVVSCGYQVAFIVPTTVLADQHFINFKQRFEPFNYQVACFSSFQTKAEIQKSLSGLKSGEISIAIGTHRLFSKDVVFNKLGLLVIDEEHRFGVKQKEQIRFKRTQVDTLALSATPIPRSLQMSLSGLRDISMINTPPIDRRKIKTRVLSFANDLIKEVIQRELRRSGQVYFVHNRVSTIEKIALFLKKLLPDVVIKVAHGQMPKHNLESVMKDFVKGDFPILLSSVIIESGLDIPNANTLIVNEADKLGLAQLYQLRGRVGRSSVQAYAYLLFDEHKVLSETATKRLKILQEHSDLGSGLKIAAYDLEIRGAGDFLGAQQSGNMALVGVDTYLSMLEEEMQKMKSHNAANDLQSVKLRSPAKVKLQTTYDAFLPEDYISSSSQRLSIYHDIADRKTEEDIWELASYLEDSFGPLPNQAKCLLDCARIKILAAKILAAVVEVNKDSLILVFNADFQPKTDDLFSFLQHNHGKIIPPFKIKFSFNNFGFEDKINLLKSFCTSVHLC